MKLRLGKTGIASLAELKQGRVGQVPRGSQILNRSDMHTGVRTGRAGRVVILEEIFYLNRLSDYSRCFSELSGSSIPVRMSLA